MTLNDWLNILLGIAFIVLPCLIANKWGKTITWLEDMGKRRQKRIRKYGKNWYDDYFS